MPSLLDLSPEILLEIVRFVPLADQGLDEDTASGEVEFIYQKTNGNSFIRGLESLAEYESQNIFPDFDLFWSMARHRLSKHALMSLSLTCHAIHDMVAENLLRVVELNLSRDTLSLDSLDVFLRIILTRPNLATHVQSLSIEMPEDIGLSSTGPSATIDELTAELAGEVSRSTSDIEALLKNRDLTFKIPLLLLQLPNLKALKVTARGSLPIWENLVCDLDDDEKTRLYRHFRRRLDSIEETSFFWDDIDGDACGDRFIVPFFFLPNVKTVYLGNVLACSDEWPSYFGDERGYESLSPVKEIIADHCLLDLGTFLCCPRALETFRYSFGGGSNRASGGFGPDIIFWLQPQKKSLRVLDIRGCQDSRLDSEADPIGLALREFPALEELGIPFASLLLVEEDPIILRYRRSSYGWPGPYSLSDALPSRLKKLRLYVYDDLRIDQWGVEVNEIIAEKLNRGRWQNLESIVVDYWSRAEEGPEDYGTDQDTDDGRADIDTGELTELAKMAGIDLRIVVDESAISATYEALPWHLPGVG